MLVLFPGLWPLTVGSIHPKGCQSEQPRSPWGWLRAGVTSWGIAQILGGAAELSSLEGQAWSSVCGTPHPPFPTGAALAGHCFPSRICSHRARLACHLGAEGLLAASPSADTAGMTR